MIPIPLPYKIAGAAIVAALAAGLGYIRGYTAQAEKVAACNSTIIAMEQTYAALEKKHADQQLVSDGVVADVSQRWSAALDHARANPRIVRVHQDCGGASGMPGLSATATGNAGLQASSGESWITASQCEVLAADSMMDREWIALAKEFIIRQHEASK